MKEMILAFKEALDREEVVFVIKEALFDTYGNKIGEGDIVEISNPESRINSVVNFGEVRWCNFKASWVWMAPWIRKEALRSRGVIGLSSYPELREYAGLQFFRTRRICHCSENPYYTNEYVKEYREG